VTLAALNIRFEIENQRARAAAFPQGGVPFDEVMPKRDRRLGRGNDPHWIAADLLHIGDASGARSWNRFMPSSRAQPTCG
jgi:hypothetical protein